MLELSKTDEERAKNLHEKSIVINAMDPTYLLYNFTRVEKPKYFLSLEKGGITAVNLNVAWIHDNFRQSIFGIYTWYKRLKTHSERFTLATKAEDIINAKKGGKIAFIFGFQGPAPIENDSNLLDIFHKLGVRVIQLTYQKRNLLADGVGERIPCGLSRFGVEVIEEMNRLGILVDLSHVGYASSMEAMEVSKEPVIFSHSNVHAIRDVKRNLTDEQIQAMAEKEGVMGISVLSTFLREGKATLKDYLDHIDYVVNLVGVDHVGIGLDVGEERSNEELDILHREIFSGAPPSDMAGPPLEQRYVINSYSKMINITRGLVARGYSDQEVEKILGRNFLRVFKKVWG